MSDEEEEEPKDKTIGIYRATYDDIQTARGLYRKEKKLPKFPSIKDTVHHIVTEYVKEKRKKTEKKTE